MGRLEYQVEKEKLRDPVCIKTIQKQKAGSDSRARQTEEQLTSYLNNLQIRFAVEERDSVIEIFMEKDSLED